MLSGKVGISSCIAISSSSKLEYLNLTRIARNTVAIVKELWCWSRPLVYDDLNDGGDNNAVGMRGSPFMGDCSTRCPMECSMVSRRDAAVSQRRL